VRVSESEANKSVTAVASEKSTMPHEKWNMLNILKAIIRYSLG